MVEKISDITTQDLADYCRIAELTSEDTNFLGTSLLIAKDYILKYTGIDSEDLDEYVDLTIVVFVLVQEMYDTRSLYVDSDKVNKLVESILNLHSVNLLASTEEEE